MCSSPGTGLGIVRGLVDMPLLAPLDTARTANHAQMVSARSWTVPAGEALEQFITANGVDDIILHNWLSVKTKLCQDLAVRLPKVQSPVGAKQGVHDLGDTLRLTVRT